MTWQKRARFVLAIVGIGSAIGVYTAIGERQKPVPAAPPVRLDPKAVLESSGNILQEVRGTKLDYVIRSDRVLTYEDGSTKLMGVEVKVRERAGRDFIISGREARAGENQRDLQLTGDVKLQASDGFVVMTDHATFSQDEGIVRAPDAVTFQKGRMKGSGTGMLYDKNFDVLTIIDQSHVQVTDEHDAISMEFFAGKSILSRTEDYLTLENNVHVLRGREVLDADRGTARFTANEEQVTFIELRGNAQAQGSTGELGSMKARDIDLDYTDDGSALERVALTGSAAIEMKGQNAAARVMHGETLNLTFAPDGSVSQAIGHDNVQLELPAADGEPARTIRAATLAGTGEPGKGLTAVRFTSMVEYREEASNGAGTRTARSDALQLSLLQDAVTSAMFTGQVRFDEQGLQARGASAEYDPVKGTLELTGADGGGRPRVADDQVSVDADAITVRLAGHQMVAKGTVKTTLQAATAPANRGRTSIGTPATSGTRLPGLLKQEQPANVSANTLDYQGASAGAVYKGDATLWQGETAIRADTITLDQAKGNLAAVGAARSTIMLDNGSSTARAAEIRYDDASRQITYSSPAATPTTPATPSQLSGPQGDLRAERIELVLQKAANGVERVEAYTGVNVRLDTRTATGARLTYFEADGRYVMAGASAVPVKVVEQCREITGKTLTFFKSTDRIIVDGNEEIRTQTRRGGGPCAAAPAP